VKIVKAIVEAASQIGLPVVDVNGEKQIGINYTYRYQKKSMLYFYIFNNYII